MRFYPIALTKANLNSVLSFLYIKIRIRIVQKNTYVNIIFFLKKTFKLRQIVFNYYYLI